MDLIDWIAASKRVDFVSERDGEAMRLQFHRYHARGFITDFIDAPVVAKKNGRKILISRASSIWGRIGVRCVAHITPLARGSRLNARVWHGPIFTAWFCFSYGLAAMVLLASLIAMFESSSAREGAAVFVAGSLMAVFWIVVTGVFNALLRVQRQASIDELMGVLSSVAKEEPNQSPEPTR